MANIHVAIAIEQIINASKEGDVWLRRVDFYDDVNIDDE